jgi:hypothetical protein
LSPAGSGSGVGRSHAVALGGGRQKYTEIKTAQEALSVVHVIKEQAPRRATD